MNPAPDPTRHLLAHGRLVSGTEVPVVLDERAAELRERMADDEAGRPVNDHRLVVIASSRAWTIADLLDELGARLRPGQAIGPVESDGSYSAVARELAQDLRRLTNT